MRVLTALLVILLLVGCHHRKTAVSDADFEAFRASHAGMVERCLNDYRYGGITA